MTPETLRESKEYPNKRAERFFKKALSWADKIVAGERLSEDPYSLTEYELAAIKLGLAKERVWQTLGHRPLPEIAPLIKTVNRISQEKHAILLQRLLSQIPHNACLADSLETHLKYCQKVAGEANWNSQDFFPILAFSQVIKSHRPQKIATRPSVFDHFLSLDLITARAS